MHQAFSSPSVDRRSAPAANKPAMTTTNQPRPQNAANTGSAGPYTSWVCPSDRQLMLRAMLGAGWSNRSKDPASPLKAPPFPTRDMVHSNGGNESLARELISEDEKKHIADILRKAEQSKLLEQNRIDSLKSRVQALKIQTRGDGASTCLLCGDQLGLFRRSAKCDICGMRFCDKCSGVHHSRTGAVITLCRVCHEQREVWKRSGAWQIGEFPELTDPPSRSVSILSNSSSNKGGVVDPNAILGGTGWRRYRSIHGHTTVVKPGRTAVLSETADTDSEGEFESTMIAAPSPPRVPQTDRLHRKFPERSGGNIENQPNTAPSSPSPSRQSTTFYDQLSMRTEVASRLISYAVSRINVGWGAAEQHEKVSIHESNASSGGLESPPFHQISTDGRVLDAKPLTTVQLRKNASNENVAVENVPKVGANFRQLFASQLNDSDKMMLSTDDLTTASSTSATPGLVLNFSSSNKALSSPMTETWSNARSTAHPSDDSNTDDAQSTTSSTAIVSSAFSHQGKGSRGDLTNAPSNADGVSLKSLKFEHEDALSAPVFDNASVKSLDVQSAAVSRPKSTRPSTLTAAVSGPICTTQSGHSPDKHEMSPSMLSPANIDRRRLSADIGRLLEPKSLPTSASSSKVALVIAASAASGLLVTPHSACQSALGPNAAKGDLHKASTSDLSSPTSSMSSVSVGISQRRLNQSRELTAAESSDVDSDVAYQLPNGAPSIAITEPGNAPDGTLHFTLMYDTAASTLICRVISAKDLASKDMNGLSDPYVKIELLPDPCKSSLVKTNVVKKCLNPQWDETVVYEGVLEEDMKAKTLRLQVLDKDPIGYDFIGEARTTLSCLPTDRLLSYNVVLKPAQKEPKLLSGALLDVGRIRLTFLYNSAESVFTVSGLRLARLARAGKKSNKDPPSPIIQIRLVLQNSPPTTHNAFQTSIQRRCVNCNFGANDTYKEKISLKELAKRVVDISVWDGHINKADCLLGSVQFGITSHGHQLRHFYQAVKTTDIAHTRWHALLPPPSGSTSGGASSSVQPPSGKQSTASSPVPGGKRS